MKQTPDQIRAKSREWRRETQHSITAKLCACGRPAVVLKHFEPVCARCALLETLASANILRCSSLREAGGHRARQTRQMAAGDFASEARFLSELDAADAREEARIALWEEPDFTSDPRPGVIVGHQTYLLPDPSRP